MAVRAFVVKPCHTCITEKCSKCAIAWAFKRDFRSKFGGNMSHYKRFSIANRCSTSLFPMVSYSFFRSKHKVAKYMNASLYWFENASVPKRSKLLNGVPIFVNYDGIDGIVENERASKHFDNHDCSKHDFDISLACKRFPSISLQHSTPVKLYDGESSISVDTALLAAKIREEVLPNYIDDKLVDSDSLYEACKSLYQGHVAGASSAVEENTTPANSYSLKPEARQDLESNISQSSSNMTELEIEDTSVSLQQILDKPISRIPGITKKRCNQLVNSGFHTLRKLLNHYPRTYADLHNAQVGIEDGQYFIFVGKISSSRGVKATSLSVLEVVVACEVAETGSKLECAIDESENPGSTTIYLHLKKFFRGTRFTFYSFLRSLAGKHKVGDIVCVSGKVRKMQTDGHYEMREYTLDTLQDEDDPSFCREERLYPIYPSKGGLKPNFLRDMILRGVQALPVNVDPIPNVIRKDFGLVCLHDAYMGIHQPKDLSEADLARKRLIFDEFFYLQLGRLYQMLGSLGTKLEKDGLLDKYRKPKLDAVLVKEWSNLSKEFLKTLPYSLTPSQLSAVSEIIWDLKQPVPMNRLLQGDVGCGKTVVASLACMEVIGSGFQAALMVPTELLALQHYENLLNLLEKLEDKHCKPSIALLTGSTPCRQAKIIRQGLKSGDISMVIGTHSLIAEKIEFSSLRIAVIDEQHRFGVVQRGRFNSKLYYNSSSSMLMETNSDDSTNNNTVMAPHVLAMSATPIPRSLALALYGDMSLTQITDLPPGRKPVKTYTLEGNETGFEEVYKMMLDELQAGGKVYIVYPVIELSEQLPQLRAASADLETISKRFPGYSCGLLHGKMKSDAKDEALRQFRSGKTNILLSTQVIEIGVDVPDASMMVVMNAERFGIAQLHQLRGRVGRGERESQCILLSSTASGLNRLKVLEKSSDGFHLANMDLLLRGPGDLLGKKQSGHLPEFPIARLEIDGNVIQKAHLAALKILGESHDLEKFPNIKAELSMRQPLCPLGD